MLCVKEEYVCVREKCVSLSLSKCVGERSVCEREMCWRKERDVCEREKLM